MSNKEMVPGIVYSVDPDDIELTDQPTDTTGLQDSIAEAGQITPIVIALQPGADKPYKVLAGNQRVVACRQLKRNVLALVSASGNPSEAMLAYYASNVQRVKDPLTTAYDLRDLEVLMASPHKARRIMGLTAKKAALLRRLLTASNNVQAAVKNGTISLTGFSQIATAPAEVQEEVVEVAEQKDGISARTVRRQREKVEAEQQGEAMVDDLAAHQARAGALRAAAIELRNAAPFSGNASKLVQMTLSEVKRLVDETLELCS